MIARQKKPLMRLFQLSRQVSNLNSSDTFFKFSVNILTECNSIIYIIKCII